MASVFRLAVSSIDVADVVGNLVRCVGEAGQAGADLIVLPETPDLRAGGREGEYPLREHPLLVRVRQAAIDANVGVILSLSVRTDKGPANVAVLMDRRGEIIGLYNKKHPAPGESITTRPIDGDEAFPVFDFGHARIGMAICMDIHFPEMFRIYGLKGADIVCVSTMYRDYTGDMLESIENARAIDSQMYLAVSRYIQLPYISGKQMGYARIIGPDGRTLASTGHKPGIALCAFDPKWRFPYWEDETLRAKYPDLRVAFDKIRRPDLYGPLVERNQED
jgi:predicted amidohydrolase